MKTITNKSLLCKIFGTSISVLSFLRIPNFQNLRILPWRKLRNSYEHLQIFYYKDGIEQILISLCYSGIDIYFRTPTE